MLGGWGGVGGQVARQVTALCAVLDLARGAFLPTHSLANLPTRLPACLHTLTCNSRRLDASQAPARASIFGVYAKQLPATALEALGGAAEGLSGRDILDVCRAAERRWVSLLLRGEVREPPLPPQHIYEEALRTRQHSGIDGEPSTTPDRGARLDLATG